MSFAIVDVAKGFSNDTWAGAFKQGAVARLTNRLPEVQLGETDFFDLSGRTKGQVVGENGAKALTPAPNRLGKIRTVKLQYTERVSKEFLLFDEQKQAQVLETLAAKWMGSDFSRDLDTIIIHGVNPQTGERAEGIIDYIRKAGSSILVPTTGDTAAAIDTDLNEAIGSLEEADISGIAFSNKAAAKLATVKENGVQAYQSLGKFGLNIDNFEGLDAASSKEVGEFAKTQLVAGDWNGLKLGIAAEMPVELIKYGDPDNSGKDLAGYNQVALRYEVIFGFGLASPETFAVVAEAPTEG